MKTLILILILIGGTMSCKSNTEPSKESNIPKPTEPTQKDTPEAKAWLDKAKGRIFRKEAKGQSGYHTDTHKFWVDGNMEYLGVAVIDGKKVEEYTSTSYFWGAQDENRGIYFMKNEDDGKIYYEGYILSNDGKTLFFIESKEGPYTNTTSILWDSDIKSEIGTLLVYYL